MPLPYDMGNAGDLLKHGLLAEFTHWWCENEQHPLRFLDPFAGQPWASPPNKEVGRRLQALPSSALREAQPDPLNTYYGSAYVVRNVASANRFGAEVFVSDRDENARRAFEDHGFRKLEYARFSPSDGFSILNSDCEGDLLLLDPFGDFLRDRASEVIPRVAQISGRLACVLFVLNLNPHNPVGQRYSKLRSDHLSTAWSLTCPKLPDRGIAGESKYEVEVLFAWQRLADHPSRHDLRKRLERLAESLSRVLDTNVILSVP